MADIRFQLSLMSPSETYDAILKAIAKELNRALGQAVTPIRNRIGILIAERLTQSPEYDSLLKGALRSELGVVDAAFVIQRVIQNLSAGCRVTSQGVKPLGGEVHGGLRIEILKGDYSEVLAADGSYRSEGGYIIDWLEWLTLRGQEVLVLDHRISYGHPARSRTDSAIMVRSGTWQVPPEYSGTSQDNWITRALYPLEKVIPAVIIEEIQRGF
jgi:hypothetical protein